MSTQTGNVSFVKTTGSALRAAGNGCFVEFAFNRVKAAPTVADTSVSRQTGLAGIWKNSFDPTSLTLYPIPGMTSIMRNNTLVVCPMKLPRAFSLPSAKTTTVNFNPTSPQPRT